MADTVSAPRDLLAQRLRDQLASHEDVREVRMFGGLSFMVDERMAVAAGRDGNLLVRTDPAAYDDLIRRGAVPAIMGNDRPMGREWLTVPSQQFQDDAELAYWVQVGIDSRNAADLAAEPDAGRDSREPAIRSAVQTSRR